jgi:predicted amidohydrolase
MAIHHHFGFQNRPAPPFRMAQDGPEKGDIPKAKEPQGSGGKSFSRPPQGHLRVAAIQFVSKFGQIAENRQRMGELVAQAAAQGAQIVVFPETALPGYLPETLWPPWRDPYRRKRPEDGRSLEEAGAAEPVPGPSTLFFSEKAKKMGLYIVVTLIERALPEDFGGDEGKNPANNSIPIPRFFNTAVLIGPEGKILLHYRKLHPWPRGDATWAQPGDLGLALCQTPWGKVGLAICFDMSQGLAERLKAAGARIILWSVGWVCDNARDWFEEMLPAKARDWGIGLVLANWSVQQLPQGPESWQGYGYSRILDAKGRVLAKAQRTVGTEIVLADMELPPK